MGSRGEPTEEEDAWAQCDACQKWRLLPKDHVVDEGQKWTCSLVGRSCNERADDAIEEPLKLDQFAKKRFVKDDKKHTAVVDAAIAAEDRSLPSDAALEAMTGYQLRKLMAQRGVGRDPQDRKEDFIDKLKAHAAGETCKKTPWWYGITNIVTAEDEDLLKFVKRKDVVVAVESCCGKTVYYGDASGLRPRCKISFSVDDHGLAGATQFAKLETYKALGLRDTKFLKQLQKLK